MPAQVNGCGAGAPALHGWRQRGVTKTCFVTLRVVRSMTRNAESKGRWLMLVINFDCPHCGIMLKAPAQCDGETRRCPNCNGLVQIEAPTTRESFKAGVEAAFRSIFGK